jgi:Protein of unknown function (DUF2442)
VRREELGSEFRLLSRDERDGLRRLFKIVGGRAPVTEQGDARMKMPMMKVVDVRARPDYRIWVRYEDGAEGEVDLSSYVGKGVFSARKDPAFFETVHVSPHGSIAWSDDIELCADSIYLDLTGKKPDELFPRASAAQS